MARAIRRFIVFCGFDRHPEQGWYDYMESFDTEAEAHDFLTLNEARHEWWQVLDSKTGELQIGRFNN